MHILYDILIAPILANLCAYKYMHYVCMLNFHMLNNHNFSTQV